jgi:hypothetical protein
MPYAWELTEPSAFPSIAQALIASVDAAVPQLLTMGEAHAEQPRTHLRHHLAQAGALAD